MLKKILLAVVGLGAVAVGGGAFFKDKIISALMRPSGSFDPNTLPPPPDYGQLATWAAHPDAVDGADVVPKDSAFTDAQKQAAVDVFFIHPTTYLSGPAWN